VNDTNVSLSADGKNIAWQAPVSGTVSVLFRVYSSTTNFTQNKLTTPASGRELEIA
jgi:hypothetical protein